MSLPAFNDTWTSERAALVGQRLQRQLVQRRRVARAAVLLLAVAVGGGAVLVPRGAFAPPGVLHFARGTTVLPVGSLVTLHETADELGVRLDEGAAAIDARGRIVIEVPPARVEASGARFALARSGGALHVRVQEGRVQVTTAAERIELWGGQSGSVSLLEQTAVEAPAPAPGPPAKAPDWRPLASHGEFDAAWPLMKTVRDDPRELLLASDVARLSGHPREAKRWLERLLARHPTDARAPLAAFTLGRVLLEELGWPRDAADAFARARVLDPAGPLAEDALAREVEAWSQAGESARARATAELYLQKYPRGQRAAGVRRHGGL